MKLSARWIEHSPDTNNGMMSCGKLPPRKPAAVIRSEAHACECFLGERHAHCAGCGGLVSKGDWDAKPIAEFTLTLPLFRRARGGAK